MKLPPRKHRLLLRIFMLDMIDYDDPDVYMTIIIIVVCMDSTADFIIKATCCIWSFLGYHIFSHSIKNEDDVI